MIALKKDITEQDHPEYGLKDSRTFTNIHIRFLFKIILSFYIVQCIV